MKKITLFTILILALVLGACSGGDETTTEKPADVTAAPEMIATQVPSESETVDQDSLTGTTWAWMAFTDPAQQIAIEAPLSYTLTFQDDGTVTIKADCNNAAGSYTLDGKSIQIEVGPMTMAECPPGSRSDDFVRYLGSVAIYFFQDSGCKSSIFIFTFFDELYCLLCYW